MLVYVGDRDYAASWQGQKEWTEALVWRYTGEYGKERLNRWETREYINVTEEAVIRECQNKTEVITEGNFTSNDTTWLYSSKFVAFAVSSNLGITGGVNSLAFTATTLLNLLMIEASNVTSGLGLKTSVAARA